MLRTHLTTNRFISLLLLAIILRLLLMPFAMHTDSRFGGDIIQFNWMASSFNINSAERIWYPLLLYLSISFLQKVLPNSIPFFSSMPINGFENQILLISDPRIFRTLTIIKTIYLIFDLGIAFLLWKISRDKAGKVISLIWLFSPIIIYNAYFHGQFDLVPIFFIVLGLYFARQDQPYWAVFWIGIAACYKNFAFLLLLPAVFILAKTWRMRFILLVISIIPYIVLMLPFLDRYSPSLKNYPNWFFKGGYDLGFGSQVYFFFVIYAALLWYLYYRNFDTFESLWRSCFAVLLVYYQFSYFDLHYWAWVVPFAIIYWVAYPKKATPFYVVISLCLLVLLIPTPLGRFLAPISPTFFLRLPSPLEALNPFLPMLFIINVVRSLLAGTCLYFAWTLVHEIPSLLKSKSNKTFDSTTND